MTWQLSHSRQLPGKAWADSMPTLSKSGPCASSQRTEPEALIRGVGGRGGCVQETLGPGDTGARLLRDCRPQQSSSKARLSEAPGVGFNRTPGWRSRQAGTPAPGREQMLRRKEEEGVGGPPHTLRTVLPQSTVPARV